MAELSTESKTMASYISYRLEKKFFLSLTPWFFSLGSCKINQIAIKK